MTFAKAQGLRPSRAAHVALGGAMAAFAALVFGPAGHASWALLAIGFAVAIAAWIARPVRTTPGVPLLVKNARPTGAERPTRASFVRHELRNVISAARIHLDLMQLDRATGDGREITAVRDALEQALALSDRLDETSDEPANRAEPAEIADHVERCARILRPTVERAGGRLDASVPGHVGDVALCDAELAEVLMNLVLNASQAIAPGGSVGLSGGRDGRSTWLRVTDDGAGMTEDVQAHLFEAGFTSKPDGHGLGMARVRQLVDGAGGSIGVDSAPGRGTAIEVRLPVAPPRAREPVPALAARPK